jgi:hypothetical protein
MTTFSLADLMPEPLTLTDNAVGGDGRTHDVLSGALLSTTNVAALTRLERDAGAALAKDDPTAADAAINRLIGVLIPTLPPERISAIPITFKTKFLEWWRAQQPEPSPKVTAAQATNATPVRRSRTSAPPTP